jgi:hypothetical protein
MTTIVDALNRIARQCSIKAPTSWVTATRDDHTEIRDDFLSEAVDDILERVDLPSPIGAQTTITGDGSETYTLPTNFKRLHRDELAVYDQTLDRPAMPITDDGMYTHIKDLGTAGIIRYYKLSGYDGNYSISFYNEPSASNTLVISYSTDYWMADSGGTAGNMFSSEDDVLLLPRRVVEAGTVWRFRERRGLPYLDKYNEYEILVQRLGNDTRSRRKVNFGGPDKNVRWQDLIPSFIPAS